MCLLCNGQFLNFLFFWKSEMHSSIILPAAWVLGSRLQHPWWKRCLRNTRAALKQVRIRNSGHILARRAAAGLKASRCALYPLLALHSFTSDNNARGFCWSLHSQLNQIAGLISATRRVHLSHSRLQQCALHI